MSPDRLDLDRQLAERRLRLRTVLGTSMVLSLFLGGLAGLCGGRTCVRPGTDVVRVRMFEVTTAISAVFWTTFLPLYILFLRKSAARIRADWRARRRERQRVERTRRALSASGL